MASEHQHKCLTRLHPLWTFTDWDWYAWMRNWGSYLAKKMVIREHKILHESNIQMYPCLWKKAMFSHCALICNTLEFGSISTFGIYICARVKFNVVHIVYPWSKNPWACHDTCTICTHEHSMIHLWRSMHGIPTTWCCTLPCSCPFMHSLSKEMSLGIGQFQI